MSKAAENKIAKRLRIIEAATELFEKKGVNLTAIDDVVRQAGVAKGTFYLYFKDKYDLLDQIVIFRFGNVIRDAIRTVNTVYFNEDDYYKKSFNFFADYLMDYFTANKGSIPLLCKNIGTFFSMAFSPGEGELKTELDTFFENVTRHGGDAAEAKKRLYIVSSAVCVICYDSLTDGTPFSMNEIRPTVHRLIDDFSC